ncbi:MAG: ThiF family adenylyltransferase [bacterium]
MNAGSMDRKPSSGVLAAFKGLQRLERLKVVGETAYHDGNKSWSIKVEISGVIPSNFVPANTLWYVVIEENYPLGQVKFYPAREGGLSYTFPHQAYNSPGSGGVLWREGKLCLDTPVRSLIVYGLSQEPLDDGVARIIWHGRRAIAWLDAASHGELLRKGDPFELPQYPPSLDKEIFVHDEAPTSYGEWARIKESVGKIFLSRCFLGKKEVFAVTRFEMLSGDLIRQGSFRKEAHGASQSPGIWWLWPKPITMEPWQAPATWGDLDTAGERLGVDVAGILREIARRIRGKKPHVLLLGYPIPLRVGGEPVEIHWKAVKLPILSNRPPKGFRPEEPHLWRRDRQEAFRPDQSLMFENTENWHPDRLQARGRFGDDLRGAKIALVGAGALGSTLAELLTRGGVCDLLILDGEQLTAGNLVRHMLTFDDLHGKKADALVRRLKSVSPYAHVTSTEGGFPSSSQEATVLLDKVSVFIDCTASDSLLLQIADCWWPIPRLFVSAFFGYKARRLFVFVSAGNIFPLQEFNDAITPWMDDEKRLWSAHDETFEGAGCWSPLFPARYDDVMLGAIITVKVVEGFVSKWPSSPQLLVFEQKDSEGFAGFQRIPPLIADGIS